MLGTYAAALMVIGASLPIGGAVLALSGRRTWSWLAPALGLAVITALAWLLVRLPGEGLAALIGIGSLAVICAISALPRVGFGRREIAQGLPVLVLTGAVVSIPFAAEGHFGILGTGFNVDMSQHLFTAEWIASPLAPAPPLIDQGYPVGPHSLAVAAAELTGGNLVTPFSGLTVAVPVIAALTALVGTAELGRRRSVVAATLVAIPYLVASYLAQGAFKELFEVTFALAFVLWLFELGRGWGTGRLGFAVPGAVIAVGALYSYSGPGLAWLIGPLGIWALLEIFRRRGTALTDLRPALPGIAVAVVVFAVAVAPEASRIAEFGTSAGSVANSRDAEPGAGAAIWAQNAVSDAAPGADPPGDRGQRLDLFNNDLGNLFGDVPALEIFGVWPSGDFRVEPGAGAVPAAVFYLGALLGLAALGVGLRRAFQDGETALAAGLAAAVLIWSVAWAFSTPYTAAKALQMAAPLLILVSLRGVLDARFAQLRPPLPSTRALAASALCVAYVAAAAGSTVLALANAPVGPERYTAGIAKLRDRLSGEPVLLLAPPGQLADRHGAAFYGWELRGARPICVEPFPEDATGFALPAPAGIRYVVTLGGKSEPPFTDLSAVGKRRRVGLWEARGYEPATAPAVQINADVPTDCSLGLGG